MAISYFLTWSAFKTHTSVSLPRYFVLRADGYCLRAMGVNETSGVSHIYTMDPEEDVQATGLGMDTWFVGAVQVLQVEG